MTENEEVERYRKILEDWKPGPPPKSGRPKSPAVSYASAAPSAVAAPAPSAVRTAPVASSAPVGQSAAGAYSPGAILKLNQRTLAVYRRAVPEKEYHLVLFLCPNSAVKVQGIALEGYEVEEIGALPPAWVERLQTELRWDRDLIVFHCYRYEDVAKVPAADAAEDSRMMEPPQPMRESTPAPQPVAPPPAPESRPEKENGALRRGQRLQIKFGNNTWDAVYWGKDDQGQVIAHQTYENWSLMHLDLNRFQNGLVVDPEIDMDLVREIEQSIVNA